MARRIAKAPEASTAAESDTVPELTLADHIPSPGVVGAALWETITSLPTALPGLVSEISSHFAPDREAGQ